MEVGTGTSGSASFVVLPGFFGVGTTRSVDTAVWLILVIFVAKLESLSTLPTGRAAHPSDLVAPALRPDSTCIGGHSVVPGWVRKETLPVYVYIGVSRFGGSTSSSR